jgi:hypothetical protein
LITVVRPLGLRISGASPLQKAKAKTHYLKNDLPPFRITSQKPMFYRKQGS